MNRLSIYTFFLISACALGLAKFLVFASSLDASDFGFYNMVLTTHVLIIYSFSFGANEAMLKLGASLYGNQEKTRIDEVRTAAMFYGILSIAAFGSILTLMSYLFFETDKTEIVGYAVVLAIAAFLYQIFDTFFRATQRIIIFSSGHFVKSLLTISMGVFLVEPLGAKGIVFAEVMSALLVFICFIRLSDLKLCCFDINNWRADISMLVKNGMSLLSSSFLRYATISIDRWAVTASLGLGVWGKYSFIMILFQIGTIVVGLFGNVLGPRWIANYSNTGDAKQLVRSIKFVAAILIGVSLVFYLFLCAVLPGVINTYFQKYYFDGFFEVFTLVYTGVLFYCINCFVDWYFICASRERILALISAFSLGLTFFGIWLLVSNHWSLVGFAFLFFCTRAISLFLSIAVVNKYRAEIEI